jgi:hypothetical protein
MGERALSGTYKVVETSDVTDVELERILNDCANESMQFAMRDSSRRPAMAFLAFTRSRESR